MDWRSLSGFLRAGTARNVRLPGACFKARAFGITNAAHFGLYIHSERCTSPLRRRQQYSFRGILGTFANPVFRSFRPITAFLKISSTKSRNLGPTQVPVTGSGKLNHFPFAREIRSKSRPKAGEKIWHLVANRLITERNPDNQNAADFGPWREYAKSICFCSIRLHDTRFKRMGTE